MAYDDETEEQSPGDKLEELSQEVANCLAEMKAKRGTFKTVKELADYMTDNVVSLLADISQVVTEAQNESEAFQEEVDDRLSLSSVVSVLTVSDSLIIGALLQDLRDVIAAAGAEESGKQSALARVDGALARIAEITAPPDEDDKPQLALVHSMPQPTVTPQEQPAPAPTAEEPSSAEPESSDESAPSDTEQRQGT